MNDDIDKRGYACPDVLVSTDWVANHLDDPNNGPRQNHNTKRLTTKH